MKREDVINKRFSRSFCGYNMREVDEFLDELIAELDTLHKVKELDTVRIRTLLSELERRTKPAQPAQTEAQPTQTGAQPPQTGAQPAQAEAQPEQTEAQDADE